VRTLVLGVSTRAMAESAMRSGRWIVAVDFFGDRDQTRIAESYSLSRDLGLPATAGGLGEAARRVNADAVVYGAHLENHPGIVHSLSRGRRLLGNRPDVLRETRDWKTLREFCRQAKIPHATTLLPGEEQHASPRGAWLAKKLRSGGGHHVLPWDGKPLDRAHVLQRRVRGRSASVAFVADGRESRVIGLTEQIIGHRSLGASGFTWCGNLLPLDVAPSHGALLVAQVEEIACRLTRRFGLRGVNGIDFVVNVERDGGLRPYLVEVNPRYCASMELMERAYGTNVFSLHLEALDGRLPDFQIGRARHTAFYGKAIVYARRDVRVPDTEAWMERGRRDIPHTGELIGAGHPVCTVFASGEDREACWTDLMRRATAVYEELDGERKQHRERSAHSDHRAYA
jgi:predicted ATP-grasp superfamily ATP-dependent carboligase